MPRRSPQHVSLMEIPTSDEGEASGEDHGLNEPKVQDWSRQNRAPPSPSLSISTTTSEIELEQGDALMRVRRLKAEELDDSLPGPEPVSDDEDKRWVPKKCKRNSAGTKGKGKKRKGEDLPW